MLINNAPKLLQEMLECAHKLGTDSIQYLGHGDWLIVSSKVAKPTYQIQTESRAGTRVVTEISHVRAVQCLAGVA